MIEFLSAPEKIETRFDLVCIASKSSFNWLLLNTFQLILDFPKNRIKSNGLFFLKDLSQIDDLKLILEKVRQLNMRMIFVTD